MGEMDTFPLVPLGRWLFPVGAYLLLVGFFVGTGREYRLFAIVRYGQVQLWWRNYFFKTMRYGTLTAACFVLFAAAVESIALRELPGDLGVMAMVFVLWVAHGMAFLACFLFMEAANRRKMGLPILLLLEGMTFLYGYRRQAARFMFGAWGMYAQSGFYDSAYGFSTVSILALEAACIAGCYWMGGCMLKRKGLGKGRKKIGKGL